MKLPAVNIGSQYTQKGNLYSESSPEVENRPFYKRLLLVCLDLSSVSEQAQCPEHKGKFLATQPYTQFHGEK
jgi:hypothetical protein